MKRLHHAKAPSQRGVLRWEWGNKDVHLVTTFVFCHVSKCYFFPTGVSLWKRVRKMPKSGTGHADAIGFRGHIYVMRWKNSSLQLGNKMVELFNIDSYHEPLMCVANHGCACSFCVQIIQRILWCYNGFCDFHWNHIQRILCSSGTIRLPARDIRGDLAQLVTELVTTREWFHYLQRFLEIRCLCLYSWVSLYFLLLCFLNVTRHTSFTLFEHAATISRAGIDYDQPHLRLTIMAAERNGSLKKTTRFTHQIHTFGGARVAVGVVHIMMEFISIATSCHRPQYHEYVVLKPCKISSC